MEQALAVVDDERAFYDHTIRGFYGERAQNTAKTLGLKGIVEEREERAECWIVTDLLTSDRFIRPFEPIDATTRSGYNRRQRLLSKYHLPMESKP
jgi:hypothetical protein